MNEIISSSDENIPNATALSEIATPLPYIKDFGTVKKIVKLFDSQKDTINTPTRDFISLQLTIAEALNNFCTKSTLERFYEIWFIIEEEVTDLSIKTDCLALVWKKLIKIDKDNHIEKSIYGTKKIEKQIKVNINKLLKDTAYHYSIVEFIIKTIVPEKPSFVFEIANSLNTQERKNVSLSLSAIHYINGNEIETIDFPVIQKFVKEIKDISFQKDIVISLIDKLVSIKEKAITYIPNLLIFTDIISQIDNSIDKCYVLTHILKILSYDPINYSTLKEDTYDKLINAWEAIDVQWRKIEIGFLITKDLVDFSKDKAKDILKRTTRLKESEPLSSNSIVNTYILSTQLCIRAFSGILQKSRNIEKEYEQLDEIIEKIQSNGEKIKLWNIVALNLKGKGREDDFKRIIREKIEPFLNALSSEDKAYKSLVISRIAPSLFYYSQSYYFNLIKDCNEDTKDDSINSICNYIFTKFPNGEPVDEKNEFYEITNSEYLEICTLLRLLNNDILIYQIISKISTCLKNNKNRTITLVQRNDIIFKLNEVINDKLPNIKDGIRHKGYWIVANAATLSIESNYNKTKMEWNILIEQARLIPNISDKALVLCMIADIIPANKPIRTNLMEEAFELIKKIPSNFDKTNRFDATWDIWLDIDKGLFSKHIKLAYNELLNNHDGTLNNLKNIIDTAHQYDKSLAENFITLLDQDPARRRLKEPLIKRITNKEKIDIASKDFKKINELSPNQYIEVFNTNLSQLNSGRLAVKKIDDTYEIIEATANTSLSIAYKSMAYFIQNAINKYFDKDPNMLLSIFEATYQNAKLVATFSSDNIIKMKNLFRYKNKENLDINPMFRNGERSSFLKYLSNWISKNVKNEIFLIDPYFSEKQLDFFKTVIEVNAEISITILTSRDGGSNREEELELQEKYKIEWKRISVDNPPENRIIIVWDEKTNKCPFHDRWLICDDVEKGLILNSINAPGESRDTQVLEMNMAALSNLKDSVITDYLYKKKSKVNGFNLKYNEISLYVN